MADDDPDDYWQPGQPWKPRRRANEVPLEDVAPKPAPPETSTPPVVIRPIPAPVEPDPVESTRSMSGGGLPPENPPPPPGRADATVMMPVITPPPAAALPPPSSRRATGGSAVPPPRVAPAAPQPPKRRGKFLRRLFLFLMVVALIGVLVVYWVESQLQRVDTPSLAGGLAPATYLIVGSDSRENLPDDLDGSFGDFGGQRADVIILAHVSGGTVQMLSLPRDLKVDIPGSGTDKINAAYAFGGGDLLAQTIQTDLGIPISHYMEVEFGGFAEIVDSVGGIELTFEYPTRDLKSGLEVDAGTQTVDGATALAYVRSRSTEELRDGEWSDGDGGDIARTARQRDVLEGVINKALTPAGLIRIPVMVPAVTSSIRVGDSTHSWNLAIFGFRFVTARANESMVLPVAGATEGGVAYVVATDEAGPAIDAFVNGDPLPLPEESDG